MKCCRINNNIIEHNSIQCYVNCKFNRWDDTCSPAQPASQSADDDAVDSHSCRRRGRRPIYLDSRSQDPPGDVVNSIQRWWCRQEFD